jgi:hypothetical protein
VSGQRAKTGRRPALVALLVVPIVLIPLGAYVVSTGSSSGGLPVAQGATAGAFHPIAGGFVPDDRVVAECASEEACLEQAFGNLAYRQGPRTALALFEERLDVDSVVEKDCHRIAHVIGSASLERFRGNVARTFSVGSPACVSGYYHGILERAFLGITTTPELVRAARGLCAAPGMRRRSFLDYQCRHGLGHGLMIQTGYDLPVALEICAGLGTGWDHKACAGGAFMENTNTRFGFRSPWLDDENPLYPCGRVAPRDQRSCYLRASWRILVFEDVSYARAADACARLGRWAATCLQGFGRDVAEKARYRPDEIVRLCRLAAAGGGECFRGAARTIANASGRPGVDPARALCDRAPRSQRDPCFAGIGLVLGMLYPTPARRAEACRRLSVQHAAACTDAAEAEIHPTGSRSWG